LKQNSNWPFLCNYQTVLSYWVRQWHKASSSNPIGSTIQSNQKEIRVLKQDV